MSYTKEDAKDACLSIVKDAVELYRAINRGDAMVELRNIETIYEHMKKIHDYEKFS